MTHARPLVTAISIFLISTLLVFLAVPNQAQAQENTWIQIEAHPTLNEAQTRVRAFSGAFPNVGGFRVSSGWYVISIGPFSAAAAAQELERLQQENLIPRDSYLADSRSYQQQFWPLGGTTLTQPTTTVEPTTSTELTPTEPVGQIITLPDETPGQARANENALSREEKMELQEAMQWEGFYTSAIDGSFGAGTRRAMAEYQAAMGYDTTGILTTYQRGELRAKFNEVFTNAGMENYSDPKAGISIDLPMGLVEFDGYTAPFVHFVPKGDSGVSVSLISQKGDQATLFGLYEIMQTLEIVPLTGERERKDASFILRGNNAKINSYTYAALENGTIKGFTLVWPAGDKANMNRIIGVMMTSLLSLGDTALDDFAGTDQNEQKIDLLSGLQIRQPILSRSGFYLDATGTVLTTSEFAGTCAKLTLDDLTLADVILTDPALGISILKPEKKLAPLGFATFANASPRLKSEVAVSGYSYEGALGAPTMTFGALADVRGLDGEVNTQRLDLVSLLGDAGGPVVNAGGTVIGMLRSTEVKDGRALPENVSFSTSANAILKVLADNGIASTTSSEGGALHPVDLTARASDMTVLVRCWN
ncbi:trypsin-like peptidase domain-containing protein [Falsihalocynthiibacter arcticus]|uniref:Peptidoglycan binding-like domain-containing protein n=1 Tax=Falsihalocynthiibacter arcticus TaxID=1579316 RepID=A0A126UV35_9RHOB|nr:trypsin-like peptidase domain-containing protein [Falsihalocynthiibacter arcticus]AML49920.1 hypothetical protein RC74_00245 [Falsihalocynthiibacter arcticus]